MSIDAPRSPASPRLDQLTDIDELTPDHFVDDALVSGHRARSIWLEAHACEFVEWGTCVVSGGTLADADFYRPVLRDLHLIDVDAANSALNEGSVARLLIERSRLTGIVWSGTGIADVTFRDCVLDLAALRDTTLLRVTFENCRLKGADFSLSKFSDVTFDSCDLSGAQFHQVQVLARSRLDHCELEGAQALARLRGIVVRPTDLLAFTGQLAAELGIVIDW